MKGRFAPSPTGYIHLGNVWIALLSYVSTKQQKGQYVVRMEDIDTQRSKRELGEALLDDLEWLGFDGMKGLALVVQKQHIGKVNDKHFMEIY